jgi:hypothetical protein
MQRWLLWFLQALWISSSLEGGYPSNLMRGLLLGKKLGWRIGAS